MLYATVALNLSNASITKQESIIKKFPHCEAADA